MSAENAATLLDGTVKLIDVLIWPTILIFVLIRFGPELKGFFKELSELSLVVGGNGVTFKRQVAEAAAAMAAAAVARAESSGNGSAAQAAQAAVNTVAGAVSPRTVQRLANMRVLWVDDYPENNRYEREALEALGIRFVTARSTQEAMERLQRQHFDVIISDMGREPDEKAGYTLLDQARGEGYSIPFIIYSSSRDASHVAQARQRGAFGATNDPGELFELVLAALGKAG